MPLDRNSESPSQRRQRRLATGFDSQMQPTLTNSIAKLHHQSESQENRSFSSQVPPIVTNLRLHDGPQTSEIVRDQDTDSKLRLRGAAEPSDQSLFARRCFLSSNSTRSHLHPLQSVDQRFSNSLASQLHRQRWQSKDADIPHTCRLGHKNSLSQRHVRQRCRAIRQQPSSLQRQLCRRIQRTVSR